MQKTEQLKLLGNVIEFPKNQEFKNKEMNRVVIMKSKLNEKKILYYVKVILDEIDSEAFNNLTDEEHDLAEALIIYKNSLDIE